MRTIVYLKISWLHFLSVSISVTICLAVERAVCLSSCLADSWSGPFQWVVCYRQTSIIYTIYDDGWLFIGWLSWLLLQNHLSQNIHQIWLICALLLSRLMNYVCIWCLSAIPHGNDSLYCSSKAQKCKNKNKKEVFIHFHHRNVKKVVIINNTQGQKFNDA